MCVCVCMYIYMYAYIYIYIYKCVCICPAREKSRVNPRSLGFTGVKILHSFTTISRPPTWAWEVARTVVAPPLSVVKCLWEVFV